MTIRKSVLSRRRLGLACAGWARAVELAVLCLLVASGLLLGPSAAAHAGAAAVLTAATTSVALEAHVEFLEDPGGRLSLAEVSAPQAAQQFAPAAAGSEINFGYSASAYWLRFTVVSGTAAPNWLLEIAFPSLDRIELYVPEGGGYRRLVVGDDLPFAARPLANRNFVIPLEIADGASATYYLRVSSSGSLTVPLRLWRPAAFARYSEDAYAGLSLYYGTLLALLLYNLLLYVSIRDRNYLVYTLFVACMAIGQLSLNGLGNQYVWPGWPAWGNVALPVGFAATGFFGALFTRGFLATRRTAPRLDRLVLLLMLAFAASAAATVLVSYRVGAILTSLGGLCFALTAVAAGIHCLRRGHPGARYFLLAWALLLGGVAVMAMRNLSWLPTNLFTSYAMQVGSAFEMLLLSFALADRINVLRQDKARAQVEALNAKQAIVDALRETERRLEARVASRTRELEDANARLRASEAEFRRMAHHDPLTGLANRLLLADRLEQAIDRAARSGRQVAVLTLDLDGFKPINDRHGHAAGDELLKTVAHRLQRALRAADTAARVGGDEFVLVLEDLESVAEAEKVAQKVLDQVAQPVALAGLTVGVTVSVGVALWPRDGNRCEALLEHADRAMYAAKSAGRNRFALVG